MADIPLGFSFEETDDGYILRYNLAGEVTAIRMAPEEFDSLKATIDLWKERRLSGYRVAAGGEVRPIVVHPVATAVLWPDAIGVSILLNVVTPSGHHMTLELPSSVATDMVRGVARCACHNSEPKKAMSLRMPFSIAVYQAKRWIICHRPARP